MWGLARHAAQLAIEYNNYSEMVTWLKEFIERHKEIVAGSVQKSIQHREIVAGSVQNQDFQEFTEIQDDANKENELELIKNPLVSRRKGRPETKRYKSATEKKENRMHMHVVHAINQDIIVRRVKITRFIKSGDIISR
ncbi:hypothetical protein Glove_90g5 [Diversispora epigaea]|uniref:Uncharacterized protein n=1 Tax=Diversispora epigaea TaxID=1348612 RepID=A0A397JCG3_9GLOM|nr:hypothetical protein Glove_90g5 [Diversispora epigaea]